MPQRTKIEISKFNKGLVTEAGPLTFPDDASLVDENFVLLKDGSRKRRLGMDYEDDFETHTAPITFINPVFSCFLWENPTQTGSFDIVVVHVDGFLYFFNSKANPISGGPLFLDGFGVGQGIPVPQGEELSAASISGQLVIAAGINSFFVLTYDESSDVVTLDTKRIKVRDLWGVESIYSVDERPAITPTNLVDGVQTVDLTPDLVQHVYNLRNQGWPPAQRTSIHISGTSYNRQYDTILLPALNVDSVTQFNFIVSDSDVPWRAKTTNTEDVKTVGLYSPYEVYKNFYGNTPAPKGKAIIDLFDRDEDRQAFYDELAEQSKMVIEGDTIVSDSATGRITQVVAYAGRLFFAISDEVISNKDSRSPRVSNLIFFSQVITSDANMGRCYQETDPTSEFDYEILDTDGGFVSIPEMGEVLKLAPLGDSLFVITTNGVWEVHGGEQIFSATNQNVTKTTNIGALSATSVVVSDAIITYFTNGGIYLISIDPSSLRGVASNITRGTLASFYQAIPTGQKRQSIGLFDEIERKIRWLYRSEDIPLPSVYDRELVFDIDLQAFYVNTFQVGEGTQTGIRGFFTIPDVRYWIVSSEEETSLDYSFGYFKNTSFRDFNLYDAKATLLTGYLTGETGSSAKQIKNIIAHFKRTETGYESDGGSVIVFTNPSGCLITAQWDWTNSANAGRWNTPFQAYRLTVPYYPIDLNDEFDYSYTVITTKTGLRGKGKALSLKFESEEGKDLHILGWGLEVKVDDKFSS